MSTHDHTTIVPGCYRCDLNKDELPTPLEAAAGWLDASVEDVREALMAALDVADLQRVLADHASWDSYGPRAYGLRCSCGADLGEHSMAVPAHDVHHAHQAAMVRTALLGAPS